MQYKQFLAITLVGLFFALGWPKNGPANASPSLQTLTWQGTDFSPAAGGPFTLSAAGLTLADTAVAGIYTSTPIAAPIPFNALVPEWQAAEPAGASLEIHLRTKKNDGAWGEWVDVHAHEDWSEPGATTQAGDMIVAPAADRTHDWVQYRVSMGRYAGQIAPSLSQLSLVFINSTDGPTTTELIAQQEALNAANTPHAPATNLPRPFVISRSLWCNDPDCWYTHNLAYEPVTHLLVHHTVTSSSGDSADTVRAIWEYHTYSQGWGDIGYNYLVDLDGVIFEGHMNENYQEWDVVGTHAGDANTGGFGTALLGNFVSPDEGSGIMPSPAMLNALADLFAWKADQRDIAIYDASRMAEMNWGLSHIIGHRDVYGGLNTLCPGGNAHDYLPWLRDAVASRIGYVSPFIMVDELSGDFSRSNANWYEGPRGCGNNGHSFYTWSTTDPGQSTNWGEWALDVPVDGRYRIDIYAPYCNTGASETVGARYTVHHAYGADTVTINQDAQVGLWMTVGQFDLAAGGDNSLYLTDLTYTDNGRGVWFDGVRLLYLGEAMAAANNLSPADGVWVTTNPVPFTWQIMSTSPVVQTRLRVATDPQLTNLLVNKNWNGATLQHQETFAAEHTALYWQVTAVIQHLDGSTESVTSPVTTFGLDATPPTSAITGISHVPNRAGYNITWQGEDATTGVTGFTIQYRPQGSPTWLTWLIDTESTAALFLPPDNRVYEFRSQAVDGAGNTEAPHATADASTNQSILLSHAIMMPTMLQRNE